MEGIRPKQITFGLIGLTILFLVSYIYFASTLTSLGYALDRRVVELRRLSELENRLSVELARRQSPQYLVEVGEALQLVEINEVSRYIDARTAGLGRLVP